ncbi:MAG: phosphoribosyltransferase family protein [Candidatus Saccharimonadales bacterium]
MYSASQHLGEVEIRHNAGELEPVITGDFTTMDEYSRFKFGDGEAGGRYGRMLGDLVLNEPDELLSVGEVYVASAAYRVAPPAAASLLQPFAAAAGLAARSLGSDTVFTPFKVSKARMATGNYAGMSFEERSRTIQDDLALPEDLDLEGRRVVMLDDIRVTGLREAALKQLLGNAGVEQTSFYYVLDVPNGKEFPQTEALINIRAVKTVDDVLALAMRPNFIPNVRLCKFILSQNIQEIERFYNTAPKDVVDTILHYIKADDLETVVKTIP